MLFRNPLLIILSLAITMTSCLTAKKVDAYIADQYGNQLPKQEKKKDSVISIASTVVAISPEISTTVIKTSKVLPLLFYWQWEYRRTSTLNPAIAVSYFTKAVRLQSNKVLYKKLQGQQLELTIEQLPGTFAFVDKAHLIWLILGKISWDKIYTEAAVADLVVSYKVLQNGTATKSGSITIANNDKNRKFRFLQSWKTAISEYLTNYNQNITGMSKELVDQLAEEL